MYFCFSFTFCVEIILEHCLYAGNDTTGGTTKQETTACFRFRAKLFD